MQHSNLYVCTTMTRRALGRGWPIEQDIFAIDALHSYVTLLTSHRLVCPLQREGGLLVIEERRTPFRNVMAIHAVGNFTAMSELLAMGIVMTLLANFWSRFEVGMCQRSFHVRWAMASIALHSTMRPRQRKRRGLMVEARQVFPCLG